MHGLGVMRMTFLGRFELMDEEYEVLRPMLPQERVPHKAGHPWAGHRKILNGLLWCLRTGAPWRDIPERYGPWSTIQTRFRRWCKEGLWQKILDTLQARSRKLGRIDFEFSAVDGASVRAHKAAAGAEKKGPRPLAQSRRKPAKTGPGPVAGRTGHEDQYLLRGPGPAH
jgi:transposase